MPLAASMKLMVLMILGLLLRLPLPEALLSVIFSRSSPGCSIVTDSVTSEGLAKFIVDDLDLKHVRYLKGYANVIGKARELTESDTANAEMAIETSGHCAMKENGYLDDGT